MLMLENQGHVPPITSHRPLVLTTMRPGSSHSVARNVGVFHPDQRQFSVKEFQAWILSDQDRSETFIRRVDLIKSTQVMHAFHEALMLHVYGPLGDVRNNRGKITWTSFALLLERAGALPPDIQIDKEKTHTRIKGQKKPKSPKDAAADRVVLIPCPLPPSEYLTDNPFLVKSQIVKSIQLPDDTFYFDHTIQEWMYAIHHGTPRPKQLLDYSRVSEYEKSTWPTIRPMCMQLADDRAGIDHYRLFATNCYYFARTMFLALQHAYYGEWKRPDSISPDTLAATLSRSSQVSVLKSEKGEKLEPVQRAVLWLNNRLSSSTAVGAMMEENARTMAIAMSFVRDNEQIFGFLDDPLDD